MKYLLIIKKMKKIFKNISYLFIALIMLNACQSVKDGLTGKKKTNSDEFLVEKKNPLTLPPEFEKLPLPTESNKDKTSDEDEIDIRSILAKETTAIKKSSVNKTSSGSLEKSILEKIKSN